jgi:hypothetical protein
MDSTVIAIASVGVSGIVGIATPYVSARAAQRRLELENRVEKEREVREVLDRGARVLEAAFWALDRAYLAGRFDPASGPQRFSEVVDKRLPAVSRDGARLAVRLGTQSEAVKHFDETQGLLRALAERIQSQKLDVADLVKTVEWNRAVAAQKRYFNSAQHIVGLPSS